MPTGQSICYHCALKCPEKSHTYVKYFKGWLADENFGTGGSWDIADQESSSGLQALLSIHRPPNMFTQVEVSNSFTILRAKNIIRKNIEQKFPALLWPINMSHQCVWKVLWFMACPVTIKAHVMISTLGHVIWGQSEPCSLAIVMPIWLRISDLLSPLRHGLCFMLTLAFTSWQTFL